MSFLKVTITVAVPVMCASITIAPLHMSHT